MYMSEACSTVRHNFLVINLNKDVELQCTEFLCSKIRQTLIFNLSIESKHEQANKEEDGPERSERQLSDRLGVSDERQART